MKAPVLLAARSPAASGLLTVLAPSAYGAICGAALGSSKGLYLILILLSLLGGLVAGMEHDDVLEGIWRGLLGGLLLGSVQLVVFDEIGKAAKADLPTPHSLLVLIAAVVGAGLGAAGAARRSRRKA
ncbi:MAG: hypothetical protein NVSMB51_13520 [Solirubrobacteraceae bacterium]